MFSKTGKTKPKDTGSKPVGVTVATVTNKQSQPTAAASPLNKPGEQVKLITSISELLKYKPTTNIQVIEVVKRINEQLPDNEVCPCFYTDCGVLLTPEIRQLNRNERVHINTVKKVVRGFNPDYSQIECTRNVFDGFISSKKESSATAESEEGSVQVESLIARAIELKVTDVHIEIMRGNCRVRFRKFSQLREDQKFTRDQGELLINAIWQFHVKTGVGLEVAKDGRFRFYHKYQNKGIDWLVRVSMGRSDANDEQTVAIRLRNMKDKPAMNQLGYHDKQLAQLKECSANRGLILVVGSVNSGKSTFQTAFMDDLDRNQKIVEISDQIEVELDHVNQLQLPNKGSDEEIEKNIQGLIKLPTRHDVDFIAINEIRDQTTAKMLATMMQQGTSGITSLHGSRWSDAVNRLMSADDLGIPPEILFSDSFFNMIVFQTLTGVLCPSCKLPVHPDAFWDDHYQKGFGQDAYSKMFFINPDGCSECSHIGVSGLTAVAELIPIVPDNKSLLRDPSNSRPMMEWMKSNQVLNVHEHAYTKIVTGEIDVHVVRRKIGAFNSSNIYDKWHGAI